MITITMIIQLTTPKNEPNMIPSKFANLIDCVSIQFQTQIVPLFSTKIQDRSFFSKVNSWL